MAFQNKVIKLPLLEKFLKTVDRKETKKILENTLIYYVHHPLQTSINVVEGLVKLGAKYEHIFILGKHYSQCDYVVLALMAKGVCYQTCSLQKKIGHYLTAFTRDINWLWFRVMEFIHTRKNINNILVMDHGGHAIQYVPHELLETHRVVGIEKTASGFFNQSNRGSPLFPIIDVANCFAKKTFESPLIANAVVEKIFSMLPVFDKKHIFGVVGIGAIGQAVTQKLLDMGLRIFIYDLDTSLLASFQSSASVTVVSDLNKLIEKSDWIFGCSGRDITQGTLAWFESAPQDKTLVSCSSEDKEFLSLLCLIESQMPNAYKPLETIDYVNQKGNKIRLLRGGFPINFDHTGESVPANEIQLTRSLVLAAAIQAIRCFSQFDKTSVPKIQALDMHMQEFIISEWLKLNPHIKNMSFGLGKNQA